MNVDLPEFSDLMLIPRIQTIFCPEMKRGAGFRFRRGDGSEFVFYLTQKVELPAFTLSSVPKRKEESSSDSEEEVQVELSVF